MAAVTSRPRPGAQVFRLLGALMAMLTLMAIGLGVARWRSADRSGSPYGALSSVAPPSAADQTQPLPVRAAAADPAEPAGSPDARPDPSLAATSTPTAPVAASVLPPTVPDQGRVSPRTITFGKGDVGQTQTVPAAVAIAAADATTKAAAVARATAQPPRPVAEAVVRPDDVAKAGVININTASAEDMNHIPGAGRIGRTIVRHRPYVSVQDLVDHRVLRASEFARIRSKITTD